MMPLYTPDDLRRYLQNMNQPQPVDLSPVVAELRRLGEIIIDHAAPQILPG